MKRDYLGDSYDAVKRMWQGMFADLAPLYAEPRFIQENLRAEFTLLTGIPMLLDKTKGVFSILNDPDTGIRLPGERNQSEGRTHIAIDTIATQLKRGPLCVITFDQSDYRNNGMKRNQQRRAKMQALAEKGLHSFYYVSHAPFLFAAPDLHSFLRIRTILRTAGIPEWRLESISKDELGSGKSSY
ncbi:MAG: hypothetical protein KKF00_05485 [Proteobacteria bacterium]|nr:hypothetical protein [Pseudomonadota bacterium]